MPSSLHFQVIAKKIFESYSRKGRWESQFLGKRNTAGLHTSPQSSKWQRQLPYNFMTKMNHPGLKKKGGEKKKKKKSWERKREQWQNNKVTMQTEEFKEILFMLLSHKFLLHSLIIARLKNTGLFDIIQNINILKSLYWALSNSLCLATVCIGQFSCNINY